MWSDERIEMLKSLYAEGLSGGRIALELGSGLTRNAVIGKCHRLGLKRDVALPIRSCARKVKLIHKQRGNKHRVVVHEVTVNEAVSEADAAIPPAQRKTLLQLTHGDCRWPVGNPAHTDFFFCGAAAMPGRSYCASHRCVAHGLPVVRTAAEFERRGRLGRKEKPTNAIARRWT